MSEPNQNPSNFNAQFHEQEIHRGKRYGKKKRSWVSIIIHLIILILTKIGNLNINLGNMDDLQKSIDNLIMVFNVFFILCLVSMFITVITIILNRTLLKIFNLFILAAMLLITLYFSYIIHTIAQKISESLKQYYLTVSPDQVINEADAIHNALILLACSIALLFISLFFRNRLARIR